MFEKEKAHCILLYPMNLSIYIKRGMNFFLFVWKSIINKNNNISSAAKRGIHENPS